MLKSAASKVMWVARATVFAVGLAVILVLLFVVANMVLGTGGKLFTPGESGETNGAHHWSGATLGRSGCWRWNP